MANIKNKVIQSIAESIPPELESYSNEDMVVFIPRFFVAGENRFDCYHFTMPRVPMPKLSVDGKEMTVYANSIFPTNPGQKLKVLAANNDCQPFQQAKYTSIFIDRQRLQELSKTIYGKAEVSFKNDNNPIDYSILEAIRVFCSECKNKQPGYEFILDSVVTLIIVNILRKLKSNLVFEKKSPSCGGRSEVKAAIDFLWENTNLKFSLKDLCKTVNLSPYYFLRLFKYATGQTPYEYYMEIKVKRALEYLKEGRYNLTEVSNMLGFSSHSHFTSVFKRKVGVTPSQFIKLNQ